MTSRQSSDEDPLNVIWHGDPNAADMSRKKLMEGIAALEAGRKSGRHPGAQLYVSRYGRPVLEFACGDTLARGPMRTDSLTSWFSASKPLTAMAIGILIDRDEIRLDDPVCKFLPGFGNGKERCTIRHVLTHQGGFANALPNESDLAWDEIVETICAAAAEYEPGTKAGYHPTTGWYILGELVRVVDGRPIDHFLRAEIFDPLGMAESHMGIGPAEQKSLAGRLARTVNGRSERPAFASEKFVERWNSEQEIARVNPGGGIRGPARDLGRFYEMLLAGGKVGERHIVNRGTVDLFTACHRWGLPDLTLANAVLAWGLGFALHGNADMPLAASRRVFGHPGMVSSIGMADPERRLVCVIITTGFLDPLTNARRLREVAGAVVEACGRGGTNDHE